MRAISGLSQKALRSLGRKHIVFTRRIPDWLLPPENVHITQEREMRRRFLLLVVFVMLLPVSTAAQTNDRGVIGGFSWVDITDDMTDERHFMFETRGEHSLKLIVLCANDEPHLMLETGYMGGTRYNTVEVRYRFDETPATEPEDWMQTRDSRNAMPTDEIRRDILDRARVASRLVVRVVDPLDGEVKSSTFNLTGFQGLYQRLECVSTGAANSSD
jgi:hypothetical protein